LTSSLAHVKFILGLACAFKAHSSCILLAMALVVGPLARGFSSGFFKVSIPDRGKKFIFDEEDRPKFPLY